MGKNKKMWNRKRKLNDRNEKQNKDRKPYAKVASTNPKMEAYYALQGLHDKRRDESQSQQSDGDGGGGGGVVKFVPCATPEEKEEERLKFMTTLQKPLSASFRIGQNMEEEFRDKLIRDVEGFVGTEIEIEVDEDGIAVDKNRSKDKDKDKDQDQEGEDEKEKEKKGDDEAKDAAGAAPVEAAPEPEPEPEKPTTIKKLAPAKHIPYIPNGYQLSVDRRTIRRNPKLQEFHEWLKVQTDAGFITRQETVSMIPPIVLSPESHHAVLDMCAGKSGHICFVLIL